MPNKVTGKLVFQLKRYWNDNDIIEIMSKPILHCLVSSIVGMTVWDLLWKICQLKKVKSILRKPPIGHRENTGYKILDIRTEQELRVSFLNQPLMPYIGAKLTSISSGKASIEVAYDKNITQQHGLFHGGISGAIADNAAGFAAMTLMGKEKEPLTIEFKINFLNIANGKS